MLKKALKKQSIEIPEVKTRQLAIQMMMAGLTYFFIHEFKKTALVLVVMFSGLGYIGHDYIIIKTSDRAKVEQAKPIGEGVVFEMMPKAYASDGNPIMINGKLYGYADPSVEVWKLFGEDVYLVWDKTTQAVVRVEVPTLNDYRMKKK